MAGLYHTEQFGGLGRPRRRDDGELCCAIVCNS